MFRRTSIYATVLLVSISLLWGFSIIHVSSSEVTAIKQKIQDQKLATSKNAFATTQQQRKDVVKEIWFTQEDNSRLHYRISSEKSLLTIQPQGKNLDCIEKLEKIQCWMQDKLYDPTTSAGPMQQIRFLAAKDGLYRYTTQEFLAQTVDLSLYRLSGHELPKERIISKPFLQGVAQDVSFGISGNNPQFKAQQFKAQLNSLEEKK